MASTGESDNSPPSPPGENAAALDGTQLLGGRKTYHAGTLIYTKAALFMLFGWLLWGDFCFQLFEQVGGPDILTLYLQNNFRITNVQTTLMLITIPQAIGMLVGPAVSFKSDRHRGPRGRRLPFIIYTTPFLCLFAAAIGCSDGIVRFMKVHLNEHSFISPLTASLLCIGFVVAGFTFFNDFVNSVFWYLFADVVPRELMGRFLGLFRMVGAIAGWLVNYAIGPHMLSHMFLVHLGVAAIYLIGFSLMCWGVREGQYPPVTDVTEQTTIMEQVRLYFTQSFRKRIYILVYISSFWWMFARTTGASPMFSFHLGQHLAASIAHVGSANALAISADGSLLLSGGEDGKAMLWDGAHPQPLPRHPLDAVHHAEVKKLGVMNDAAKQAITAVAISADGTLVFTGDSAGAIRKWRLGVDVQPDLAEVPRSAVLALAVSPDGTRLASGHADGTLCVWDIYSHRYFHTKAHDGEIRCVAFSSDNGRVASGGTDKKIQIHSAYDGAFVNTLKPPGPVYSICFCPSLGPGSAPPAVSLRHRIWDNVATYFRDVFTNESLYEITAEQRSTILSNDAWIVSGGQDEGDDKRNAQLRIWDIAGGTLVMQLVGHKEAITSVQYKADLHAVVTGSLDRSIRLWDPAQWQPINPDAQNNLATDQCLRNYAGYTDGVTAIAAPSSGKIMASASHDGGIHLWDIDAGISLNRSKRMTAFFLVFAFLLYHPFGVLVDRLHPIPLTFWASLVVLPAPIYYYFFQYDYRSVPLAEIVKVPMYTLIGVAQMPMLMAIFPKTNYGQLASANSFIRQFTALIMSISVAKLMDVITKNMLLTENYRYGNAFQLVGFIGFQVMLFYIYRHWVRAGCPKSLHEDT